MKLPKFLLIEINKYLKNRFYLIIKKIESQFSRGFRSQQNDRTNYSRHFHFIIIMRNIKTIIGPSILSADAVFQFLFLFSLMLQPFFKNKLSPTFIHFANLKLQCQNVLGFGADSLHIDIMDGHFVNNLTIGPPVVSSLRKNFPNAHLDCHLMVTDPENYLEPLSKSSINCFTFHLESNYSDIRQLLTKIKSKNISAGVSIKPKTLVTKSLIELAKQGLIDKLLVMTVQPGFGGQKFMEQTLPKIKQIREALPEIDIQVDGGINQETAGKASAFGANCFVAGNSVFASSNRKQAIDSIRKNAEESFCKNVQNNGKII